MLQKTQSSPEKHTVPRLQVPAKPSPGYGTATNRSCRSNCAASSPRPRQMFTRPSSYSSSSVRGGRQELLVPTNKSRRHWADKEILMRALTPPVHRLSRRWWDFRPTPSRLSSMSVA